MQRENYGCVPNYGRRHGGDYQRNYDGRYGGQYRQPGYGGPRYGQEPSAYRPGECGPGYQKENYGCVPNYGGRYGGDQYRQRGGYGGPRYGQEPSAYRPGECGPGYQKENYGCVPNVPRYWR